jgi:hypothetical protein
MQYTGGLPFGAPAFKGGANQNGIPVVAQGVALATIGGILSPSNTTTSGNGFGSIMSRLPGTPNEFYYGLPTSGIVAGPLVFDASIAQNDPAHADYPLLGQPVHVGFLGSARYNRWNKTLTGAIDPVPGCVVAFRTDNGAVEFLPAGTSADPSGGKILTGAQVVDFDELGFNGIAIKFNL